MSVDPLTALRSSVATLCADQDVVQDDIAKAAGVDQGLVSRLIRGRLKRMTSRLRRIEAYVDMRLRDQALPDEVSTAVRAYLVGGGDPELLCEQLRLMALLRSPRMKQRG